MAFHAVLHFGLAGVIAVVGAVFLVRAVQAYRAASEVVPAASQVQPVDDGSPVSLWTERDAAEHLTRPAVDALRRDATHLRGLDLAAPRTRSAG